MSIEKLASFTNEEYGIECYVIKGAYGFHVILKDLDCDEVVPCIRIFKSKEEAVLTAEGNVK